MPTIFTNKKLPERIEKDFYPTPEPIIRAALARFGHVQARVILDIGAGDGRWGIAAAKQAKNPLVLVGVDIRPLPKPDMFTFWHMVDYSHPIECEMMSVKSFDFIVSNPPFAIAEAIIWQAWKQLKNGGLMLFLLPADFWYSIGRYRHLWRELPPLERCSVVNRIPFTGDQNPNNCDLYLWGKDGKGKPIGKSNETRNTQIMF